MVSKRVGVKCFLRRYLVHGKYDMKEKFDLKNASKCKVAETTDYKIIALAEIENEMDETLIIDENGREYFPITVYVPINSNE